MPSAPHPLQVVFCRFGLGPKPDSLHNLRSNPIDLLRNELRSPNRVFILDSSLPNYSVACARVGNFSREYSTMMAEVAIKLRKSHQEQIGFFERLVQFWSNHFSMFAGAFGPTLATIGQWERQVVRPRLTGNFEDLLFETITHPSMLHYLTNADSIGPQSPAGSSSQRGNIENLSREILELHTLGNTASYTSADVTQLSMALTGLSYVRGWEADNGFNGGSSANRGQRIYRQNWHQPGNNMVLGRVYSGSQQSKLRAITRDLARRPETARNIARKIAKYFISDTPPQDLVLSLETAYSSSGGNLLQVYNALIEHGSSWTTPMAKARTPYEYFLAMYRSWGQPWHMWPQELHSEIWTALGLLENRPWHWPTPDGYPDSAEHWLSPDGMRLRLLSTQRIVWRALQNSTFRRNPQDLAARLFGPWLSPETRQAIPTDPRTGLITLFMSPEFQRR